jgi:hypothetical protein
MALHVTNGNEGENPDANNPPTETTEVPVGPENPTTVTSDPVAPPTDPGAPTEELPTAAQSTQSVDSNEEVKEPQMESPQATQIAQGMTGDHPNQQMSPRAHTSTDSYVPARDVPMPDIRPSYPPSENHQALINSLPNKSAKIRWMHSRGYTTSQISRHLGILYQHARNVLTQQTKRPNPLTMSPMGYSTVVQLPFAADTTKAAIEASKLNMTTEAFLEMIQKVQKVA